MAEKTTGTDGEANVLAAIAAMSEADRALAERVHALVTIAAPSLVPRLWYGMPAYAKNGKVICFFQSAQKFNTRYATFGFEHDADLDEGSMWPVAFAVKQMGADEEARITDLVKRAIGEGAERYCRDKDGWLKTTETRGSLCT